MTIKKLNYQQNDQENAESDMMTFGILNSAQEEGVAENEERLPAEKPQAKVGSWRRQQLSLASAAGEGDAAVNVEQQHANRHPSEGNQREKMVLAVNADY
jgi:hypothetical protein